MRASAGTHHQADPNHSLLREKFGDAANPGQPAKLSRAEQIKRDMQGWRRKNGDKAFGREM